MKLYLQPLQSTYEVYKMKIENYDYGPIGKRIRMAREEKRITQEQLGEYINRTDKHISEVERGISGLSVPVLMQICKILDVDADYLLFGKLTDGNNNPFNALMKQLTPEQAMAAEELLSAYVKSCKVK